MLTRSEEQFDRIHWNYLTSFILEIYPISMQNLKDYMLKVFVNIDHSLWKVINNLNIVATECWHRDSNILAYAFCLILISALFSLNNRHIKSIYIYAVLCDVSLHVYMV